MQGWCRQLVPFILIVILEIMKPQTLFSGYPQTAGVIDIERTERSFDAHLIEPLYTVFLPRLRIAAIGQQFIGA